ncbi:hypothetical protein OGM63_05865 [Plectonema radiosum NIES-515]|uniref:2-isopropylmalate synthase n=1 Tax=Plectonema radiosum NIES-515 TaxID=2986073 RepID=A0ABT3AVK1_9CYAN|nr:hypothetical protein [Plectonema radiosum NIES-515]
MTDDIREVTQAAFVRKPSLEERKELLNLAAKVGVHNMFIGFPAISQQEFEECRELIRHIEENKLGIKPICLARTLIKDLESIVALAQASTITVQADFFLGTSPIRRRVEDWDLDKMLDRLAEVGKYLSDLDMHYSLAIEDATRTPADDLDRIIKSAIDAGVKLICLCDTVGESLPSGAARITQFTLERIAKAGVNIEVEWHGHNDKGLSVACAMASAMAGADSIAGTFLGIGERSGNSPLEQVIVLLYQAGNNNFNLEYIKPYCEKLAEYTESTITPITPLVGKQVFATAAGTHSAAILKARKLGIDFEDYVFSGVPASKLGLSQDIIIGPTSGMTNVRYALEQIGIPLSEELASNLLAYAKSKDRWLSRDDIRTYINSQKIEAV